MKILFYIDNLQKGGAERVISNLSNYLIKDNEIDIMLNSAKEIAYELNSNIKLIEIDKEKDIKNPILKNIRRLKMIKKEVRKEKPDVIISFLPTPSYRMLLLKKQLKRPIIVAERNNPEDEYSSFLDRMLMKKLYKKADGFVFQTNDQKKYFDKNIQNNSVVIFNPIKEEFMKKNLEKKENIIINVGRLTEQKNQEMLINAFAKVYNEHKEYKLKIFGQGPLKERLQKQIDNLNLNGKVILEGVSNNIKTELGKAKIFVMSSRFEGMPNALIEAMSQGLAAISTDCPCGGPKELIQNGINGFLIENDNEEELTYRLSQLLNDENMINSFSNEAEKIKENLRIDIISNQWKKYIDKIVNEYKRGS